jgi:hypothetical protein
MITGPFFFRLDLTSTAGALSFMKQPDNHRSKSAPGKSVPKEHLQFSVACHDSVAPLVNPIDTPVTNWLVFTLAAVPANLNNWDFAAHVQYNDGCSGWVSDRTHPNPGSSDACGSASVPEPSAMILFGIGLVGVVTWDRRRLGKERRGSAVT